MGLLIAPFKGLFVLSTLDKTTGCLGREGSTHIKITNSWALCQTYDDSNYLKLRKKHVHGGWEVPNAWRFWKEHPLFNGIHEDSGPHPDYPLVVFYSSLLNMPF